MILERSQFIPFLKIIKFKYQIKLNIKIKFLEFSYNILDNITARHHEWKNLIRY